MNRNLLCCHEDEKNEKKKDCVLLPVLPVWFPQMVKDSRAIDRCRAFRWVNREVTPPECLWSLCWQGLRDMVYVTDSQNGYKKNSVRWLHGLHFLLPVFVVGRIAPKPFSYSEWNNSCKRSPVHLRKK